MEENDSSIFTQINNHSFDGKCCFLCGCKLTASNKTQEHVIPKWLQHEFNLWDKELTLLNHSKIRYRQLTIPCCFKCNNVHLRPFEDSVKTAYEGVVEAFYKLSSETLFYWLGKIYFGLLYKELFLEIDRKDSSKGSINDKDYVKEFYSLLLFLQGVRKTHKYSNFSPSSIFIFRTQKTDMNNWDFRDSQNFPLIAIRMGEIGVIALLLEGGTIQQATRFLDQAKSMNLHPIQFNEILAKLLYSRILLNRTPKFTTVESGNIMETYLLSMQGMSNKPIFDSWNNDEYAQILSQIVGTSLEVCQPVKGHVWTWLHDDQNHPIFMDINQW